MVRADIVRIADRPDLAPVVAAWIWDAFWRSEGYSLDHVRRLVQAGVARLGTPQIFVLLADGEPAGTASFVADDLDARPDLTPWLAAVFITPHMRGRGYVRLLVEAVEIAARESGFSTCWLYTSTAESIYARAGWRPMETFNHYGAATKLMCRILAEPPGDSGTREYHPPQS